MKIPFAFMFILSFHVGQAQFYEIVLATDFDGMVVNGSKDELIKYIREGKPVRVGWQLDFNEDKKPDFDHWVEATFITILGQEVFTQIDPIYAQGPNLELPQVEIYSGNTRWTALIGTNGKMLNRFVPDDNIPTPIFDESMGFTEEEIKKQLEAIEKNRKAMKQVNTWNVATFWSIQK